MVVIKKMNGGKLRRLEVAGRTFLSCHYVITFVTGSKKFILYFYFQQ